MRLIIQFIAKAVVSIFAAAALAAERLPFRCGCPASGAVDHCGWLWLFSYGQGHLVGVAGDMMGLMFSSVRPLIRRMAFSARQKLRGRGMKIAGPCSTRIMVVAPALSAVRAAARGRTNSSPRRRPPARRTTSEAIDQRAVTTRILYITRIG